MDVETGYDPGPCSNTNHGKLKLAKNRENKDRLLVCSEEEGVFKWIRTDGKYIKPGPKLSYKVT